MTIAVSEQQSGGQGPSPRLSDRILHALDLALIQEDIGVCEALVRALELAMTRNTGGRDFIERRDYPPEIEDALDRLARIKDGAR